MVEIEEFFVRQSNLKRPVKLSTNRRSNGLPNNVTSDALVTIYG